jgi:hypothetical protein
MDSWKSTEAVSASSTRSTTRSCTGSSYRVSFQRGPPERARYTETYTQRISRVGLWLVFGITAFGIFGFRRLAGPLSGKSSDAPVAVTLMFAYLTVVYATMVGNLVEVGENQRFRFTIDPLIITGLALLTEGLLVRFGAAWRRWALGCEPP